MSAARALVTAQLQSAWNRMRHESGLGGARVAFAAAAAIAGAVLVVPSAFMFRIGTSLGDGMARGSPEALAYWNQVQAVFTLLFPLLGSFRFAPALTVRELGAYPLSRTDLALAEGPASAVEVFPLLGLSWIVATHAGLAWTVPAWAPFAALLAALGVAGMLALTILLGSVGRLVLLRRGATLAVAAFLFVACAGAAANGWAETLRGSWRHYQALSASMPCAFGYEGLVALRGDRAAVGVAGLFLAAAATAGLAWLAALAHHRALVAGAWGRTVRRAERPPARYRGPAAEVAAVTFRQLSRIRSVWVTLVIPLLMTGPALLALHAGRLAAGDGQMPKPLVALGMDRLERAPLLAITLLLGVLATSQIWLNQFGTDRAAIRALLALPIAPRDILAGKLSGLLRITLAGWAICGGGVLLFHRASSREVAGGVAAAGVAFVVAGTVGQFASLVAPRPFPRGGLAQTPLSLGWIPAVLLFVVVGLLAGIWSLGEALGPWVGPALLWAALGGTILARRGVLLPAERFFLAHRERLLSM